MTFRSSADFRLQFASAHLPPTCRLIAARPKATGSALLVDRSGNPMTRDSIDAQILCAAHDAGIDASTQVTSECLRHTYVAFLVRQGMRFGDLAVA